MLKKLVIYMLIGIIVTAAPLYYMDSVIFADTSSTQIVNKTPEPEPEPAKSQFKLLGDGKFISFLYDRNYVSYIEKGQLKIRNVKNNDVYRTIDDEGDIVYSLPLQDRNIVMYLTYDYDKLYIKTYDLDKNETTEHKYIKLKGFSKVRDVKYSALTNVIYIDVRVNEEEQEVDKIYRIDLMNDVTLYEVNKEIEEIMLLNAKDTLIYEDGSNNVYIKGKLFKYQNYKKFKLLGVDGDDRVYVSPLNKLGEVLVIKDNKVEYTKYITETEYDSIINRDNKIYLIYKDHVFDLVNDKKIEINPGTKVVDISGGSIIYENSHNEIVTDRIKL